MSGAPTQIWSTSTWGCPHATRSSSFSLAHLGQPQRTVAIWCVLPASACSSSIPTCSREGRASGGLGVFRAGGRDGGHNFLIFLLIQLDGVGTRPRKCSCCFCLPAWNGYPRCMHRSAFVWDDNFQMAQYLCCFAPTMASLLPLKSTCAA